MTTNEKQKALDWNNSQLLREMTNDDPHKRDHRGRGKHKGKTKGAFGKRRHA
jgi:hypothetical protein